MLSTLKTRIPFAKGVDGFRNAFTGMVLVAGAFIWYLYGARLLSEISLNSGFSGTQTTVVWGMNILGTAAASVFGFFISNNVEKRVTFLRYWLLVGIPLSLTPAVVDVTGLRNLILFFTFVGVYFGLGMPISLAYFASVTRQTNRSRLGGMTFLAIFAGVFLLGMMGITNIAMNALVLATCKIAGLMIILVFKPVEKAIVRGDSASYGYVLTNRAFILYFVPWIMFSIANYISLPIVSHIFPSLFEYSMMIENLLAGAFVCRQRFFR